MSWARKASSIPVRERSQARLDKAESRGCLRNSVYSVTRLTPSSAILRFVGPKVSMGVRYKPLGCSSTVILHMRAAG